MESGGFQSKKGKLFGEVDSGEFSPLKKMLAMSVPLTVVLAATALLKFRATAANGD